jgi:hypothetical protein
MGTAPLEEWVERELSGYTEEDMAAGLVPGYRGPFQTVVMGQFEHAYARGVITREVPSLPFPKDMRTEGWLFRVGFLQAIAELEPLARGADNLQNPWHPDALAVVQHRIDRGEIRLTEPGVSLVRAYRIVTPHQVRGVLDAVRTRVLKLALEIERIEPEAGKPGVHALDDGQMQQVINVHVYGSNNALNVASAGAQSQVRVRQGNLDDLLKAAAEVGASPEEVDDLRAAIEKDGDLGADAVRPGPNVNDLVSKIGSGAAGGAAGAAVGALVRAFFGM